ncbi:MAG: PDZ domain-containing protein [Anaerolineae bacterium]
MEKLMIHESTSVAADPADVAAAIASPHGMSVWLSNEARSDRRPDGFVMAEWWDGRRLVGRWTTYEPPSELSWQWRDDAVGDETTVSFALTEGGEGTDVQLTVAGVPASDAEPQSELWGQRLADLKTYVESGINAREARRAMVGIMLEAVDEELAERQGLPVTEGIWLSGVVDDGGASKAGLRKGDVIVALDDVEVKSFADLSGFLGARKAGDTITVRYWRDGEEHTAEVTTQPPPRPDFPRDLEGLREYVAGTYTAMPSELRDLLADATPEEAEFKPAEGEWSINEILAHLVTGEKYGQDWISRELADAPTTSWPIGVEPMRMPIVAALGLASLLDRFENEICETRDICLAALEGEPKPTVTESLGGSTHFGREHFDDHLGQIKANLEVARGGTSSS